MKKLCVFSIVLGIGALVFVLAAQTSAQITSKTKPAIAASSAGYSAALKYLYGDGVPQNEAEARRRLHVLASQGNSEARFALLTLDLPANRSDSTASHTRAGKDLLETSLNELDPNTLQQRANAGEALAELILGYNYFYGGVNGIPKDDR
jgi:TPR repeat protein